MSFSIAGKTAIVTGGGNGVGLAIGRHFLEAGAQVVFADRDEEALEREIGALAGEEGAARLFAGDLREKLTVANLLSLTMDAFGRVDILVNAARTFAASDPLDAEGDQVGSLIEQNLYSALRLSQMAARRMIRQSEGQESGEAGAIVNVSTIAGRLARPDTMAYSMAAAALDQMTRSLAVALAPHRIRVNAVAFGSVLTSSLKALIREDETLRPALLKATPLGRLGAAGDLAEAAQFLASDAARFITGQVLTVDGGRSLIDPAGVGAY